MTTQSVIILPNNVDSSIEDNDLQLKRELLVMLLDLLVGGGARDAEHLEGVVWRVTQYRWSDIYPIEHVC